MRRFVGMLLSLGVVGAIIVAARKLLMKRPDDSGFDESEAGRGRNVVTPMPFLDHADPENPPHKAHVEAKKAEAPKPAAPKSAAKKAAATKKAAQGGGTKNGAPRKAAGKKKSAPKPPPPGGAEPPDEG